MKIQHEQWKPIAECNGDYYISSYGRVKSCRCTKEKIMKPQTNTRGYLSIGLMINGKQRMQKIHRLVANAFIANPENKPQVNHIDANKLNNCISNLEWVTQQENIQHAYKNGLFESQRLALSKARSKPVIDIITKKKYISLKSACDDIGEPYSRHLMRIYMSYKTNRFMYI